MEPSKEQLDGRTNKLDLILFGATGFTGKLCISHIIDHYIHGNRENKTENNFKFGLASRNIKKLKEYLNSNHSDFIDSFVIIKCDSMNKKEIDSMVKQTNVIISTVGPYCVFGENLIQSCANNGCYYCDLTGEFHWVKQMIVKYNDIAIENSAKIVNISGMLAAVADCAMNEAVTKLKSKYIMQSNSNDSYECATMLKAPWMSASESGGSLLSILNMLKQGAFETYYSNKKRFCYYLCENESDCDNTEQQRWNSLFPVWNYDLGMYQAPMVFAGEIERMQLLRSNHLLKCELFGKEPVIHETNLLFETKYWIIAFIVCLVYFIVPWLLSFGVCIKMYEKFFVKESGDGPDMKTMLAVKWKQYICIENRNNKQIGMTIDIDVFGDYMYYNTAKLLVEQGIILALQKRNVINIKQEKEMFGFITPSIAFGGELLKRLNNLKQFDVKYKYYN